MKTSPRRRIAVLLSTVAIAAVAWFGFRAATPASALISGTPCPGNVCTGSAVVGGQTVNYSYTQHLSPNGELKVRLNGGVYNTSGLVSFILFDLPAFSTWNKYANPTNGAVFLPLEDVNPGRTAYERKDNDGCTGCIVDQVMSVKFTGLAAGQYDFNLSIIQNGDTGGQTLTFFVDAAAPSNGNESNVWGAISGMDFPCADAVDNDLDFGADCADVQCSGSVGNVGSGAICEQPENTCNDGFDNDADGKPDCLDSSCDGKVGQPSGTALCQYGNEYGATTCGDVFDNDADGLTDCIDNLFDASAGGNANTICWKKPAYSCPATETSCTDNIDNDKDKSYDDAWDSAPLTGRDCQDYDCAGNPACPANENKTAAGTDADDQCFNGIDDDLDHAKDCADADCKGIVNPFDTTKVCYDKEFDLGQRYQYCGNAFDDDGDGPQDCADSDCTRRFGNCGPCPSREDITYDSCADGKDNDTDVVTDCGEVTDCASATAPNSTNLGTLGHAAMCATSENTNDLCGDLFDNDLDAKIDCADAQCVGKLGPELQACQPAGETSCGDAKDNDGDAAIDCADSNCWGVGTCAPKNWTDATCQIVPRSTAPTAFTSNDPTILAEVRVAAHVSSTDVLRFTGSGTYSSVTIIVGDNTDALKYYPYAAASPTCTLLDTVSGLPYSRLTFLAVAGHAIQIYNTPGGNFGPFDVTLTCATPATPAAVKNYPISISILKQPGDVAEYGDVNFSTTLYENTVPNVIEVEPEGAIGGTVRIPYGGPTALAPQTRRFRGVPVDPGGAPPLSSGICRCDVKVNTGVFPTAANCMTAPLLFTDDMSLTLQARAEDGAGNLGSYYTAPAFTANVTPTLTSALTVGPSKPFFRTGQLLMDVSANFATATSDFFNQPCEVYVRTPSGTIVGGPPGPVPPPSATFAGMAAGNTMTCLAQVSLPTAIPDGTYYVTVGVRDNDGDTVESNRKAIFVCNDVPGPGDADPGNGCAYADFDTDGAAEGLYTTLYSTSPKACDNCVGLPNALQTDANANGVGDVCEPNKQYGRCEIDRDIVCECDSDEVCDYPCPGPSIGEDFSQPGPPYPHKDPQRCVDAWGLCTIGGQICFNDLECTDGGTLPAGFGTCQDGITSCKRDVDCTGVTGVPACTGSNRCENLLYPWLQTQQGNVFSKKRITAPDVPPSNQYNATFCITAKDIILNFSSELCGATTDATVKFERPKAGNTYSTVLGKLDIAGLRSGKYGTVIDVPPGQLDTTLSSYSNRLGGRVFRVTGDETVTAHTIYNDATKGSGTIFIDGGNLNINGDFLYDTSTVTDLRQLASLGWIVIDNGTNTKGNVYVDGAVTNLVGAFYVGGDDGFWSVAPPAPDSPTPLTLYGLVVARQFHLSRSYKSVTQGSEKFVYDGRAVVNPPPGFGDVTKTLPIFADTAPQ